MSVDYLDSFRDPAIVRSLINRITDAAAGLGEPVRLMEVCGGHTTALYRFGIPSLLPRSISLVSGPGCPVCVTPAAYIDAAITLGEAAGGIIATFGDLYRVPGSGETLEDAAARGLDVRVVYSPLDALNIAENAGGREVLFLAVGFETTAPVTAAVLEMAAGRMKARFRVMSAHKTMPQALRALVGAGDAAIDGLILPGHVSTVTGTEPYLFLAEDCRIACCVAGFEPVDILLGILSLVEQCAAGAPVVDNRYGRAVRAGGNPEAQQIIKRTFRAADSFWRGMGCIKHSGLDLAGRWSEFHVPPPDPHESGAVDDGCRCGEVLRGLITPSECALFASTCTPEHPAGPCMISSEGACAARYKYAGPDSEG